MCGLTHPAALSAQPHSLRPDALCAGGGHGWWWVLPAVDLTVKLYNI